MKLCANKTLFTKASGILNLTQGLQFSALILENLAAGMFKRNLIGILSLLSKINFVMEKHCNI